MHEPDSSYQYDVFISYSSKDAAWVRGELLKRLEGAGLRVCLDVRDFQPGAPSVQEMERAVTTSRKTLLVLTPSYLASDWTGFEALMLQTIDPASRERRLIPLLKQPCNPPPRISYLTNINFVERQDWRRLLDALGAKPAPLPGATREGWYLAHPYPMPPNFTGREAERALLTSWLTDDTEHPVLVLRALGGFGKSALTWHWLTHDVQPAQWPRVVWWSFYERDASFERFLPETLRYLGADVPPGQRDQVALLLELLRQPGVLLVLDGFERELRAFSGMGAAYQGDETEGRSGDPSERDCVNPTAEDLLRAAATLPHLRGKLLLTTRLRPRALEVRGELLAGCRERELTGMSPEDALAFFRAQGIRGNRNEIEQVCAAYGYHPLTLRLLAGKIAKDLRQPSDIAVADQLDLTGDLVQRRTHVLQQAYDSLTPERRELLSRIACFRSPVTYDTLVAVTAAASSAGKSSAPKRRISRAGKRPTIDADLQDLLERGLLQRTGAMFDLHPIVRRYAYDRPTHMTRRTTHKQLRSYFAAVETPNKLRSLDELQPVIELYHHTVRAGQYDAAYTLYSGRIRTPIYYQFGAYALAIELLRALFPDGEERLPRLSSEQDQAWTLNSLAASYYMSGQPLRAVTLGERALSLHGRQDNKLNFATMLANLAQRQLVIGKLRETEAHLRRCISLSKELNDIKQEAIGHQELGRLLTYWGAWAEAEQELAAALAGFEQVQDVQGQGVVWAYRALHALLMFRAEQHDYQGRGRIGSGAFLVIQRGRGNVSRG